MLGCSAEELYLLFMLRLHKMATYSLQEKTKLEFLRSWL